MRGHIEQRTEKAKDSWSIKVSLGKDNSGKYRYKWFTVWGSKKDAEKRLSEILHELDTGNYIQPGKITLAVYLDQWLKDSYPNLSPRSFEGYEYMVRKHILPAIGQIPLTQLKPQHLQQLYSEKLSDTKGKLSSRTVQYIHNTLHKSLADAVKLGIIARNPAGAVSPPKVYRRELKTMSEADIHFFLELARATPYYALFYTTLFTGMRRGELLALRWSDVDLILGQLSVNRTLHHLTYEAYKGQFIFRQPKTEKGKRLIALSPSTISVLREHRDDLEKLRESLGIKLLDSDLVFCQYDGKPLLPDSITHAWMKLARRSGLKGIRLHDARHTHASLMLKQGIHPKIVQERVGHASIQITLDTYSHVAPGFQQAAANRFDDIVIQGKKELSGDAIGEN